jgi:sigma-B regulation protein RsbU (phosphoserine phosphatase)
VLYTDGVIEAMNASGDEYGQDRFLNLLQTGAAARPDDLIQTILTDIKDFTRGHPQHDDITLVTIRRVREGVEAQPVEGQRQTG